MVKDQKSEIQEIKRVVCRRDNGKYVYEAITDQGGIVIRKSASPVIYKQAHFYPEHCPGSAGNYGLHWHFTFGKVPEKKVVGWTKKGRLIKEAVPTRTFPVEFSA